MDWSRRSKETLEIWKRFSAYRIMVRQTL